MPERFLLIDICGTLYFSNTTFDFLDCTIDSPKYRMLRRAMHCRLCRLANNAIYRLTKTDLFRRFALKNLKGSSRDTLIEQAQAFYHSHLLPRRNAEVFHIINTLRATHTPVLVSGTIDPVATVISQQEHIPLYISSRLEYHDNICTGQLATDILRTKSQALKNINILPPYACIITDNPGDLPLIRQAEKAYIICYGNEKRWQLLTRNLSNITLIHANV